jgi:hypothetical protein
MRKKNLAEYTRKSLRVTRPNEKTMDTPVSEQTIITVYYFGRLRRLKIVNLSLKKQTKNIK